MEVGVDIGGTFTDIVYQNRSGTLKIAKVPTSYPDPSLSVLDALPMLLEEWGILPAQIERFVHGTTVATNAVLERKGSKTGILATKGFRDVIELGRQMRTNVYSMNLIPETPVFLAPRRYRREVNERISSSGEIITNLDEKNLLSEVKKLVEDGVQSIAISFLFSFLNSINEERAAKLIKKHFQDIYVSISSEVDPFFREYERTVITAFDAYIKPVVDSYLRNLENGLKKMGILAPLQVMQSRGGINTAHIARERPVRLFLSGPAAGVVGAKNIGYEFKTKNLISIDIGGTSCDIAIIQNGKALIKNDSLVAGYKVRVPMVDINAIGSGGGSIAWLDTANALRVGPKSAGSSPGPACYNKGGTEPTVTDASVVLGYLNPESFADGRQKLESKLAVSSIRDKLAIPMGLSIQDAALGIHRVVTAQMVEGIRLVTIKQGFDPRDFSLIALGGSAGIHICILAEELGTKRILLPRYPGVLSAHGMLSAPVEHELSAVYSKPLEQISFSDVKERLEELDKQCLKILSKEVDNNGNNNISYYADICFTGQSHHIEVPFTLEPNLTEQLRNGFAKIYTRKFGHSPDVPERIVNLRTVHSIETQEGIYRKNNKKIPYREIAPRKNKNIIIIGYDDPVKAKVFNRSELSYGATFNGPALIEQSDTTTVVYPNWSAFVEENGCIILENRRDGGVKNE